MGNLHTDVNGEISSKILKAACWTVIQSKTTLMLRSTEQAALLCWTVSIKMRWGSGNNTLYWSSCSRWCPTCSHSSWWRASWLLCLRLLRWRLLLGTWLFSGGGRRNMDMLGIMAKMIHHFDRTNIAYCHILAQTELCFNQHLPHDTLSSTFIYLCMIPVWDLITFWFGSFSLSSKYMI